MRYTKENGGKPFASLGFFPYSLCWNIRDRWETTLGQKEEGIASPKINTGFFASLVEMKDVMATLPGTIILTIMGMLYNVGLAFRRVSGWDAYGNFERKWGGRIIELREGKFEFDSWIRTPSGRNIRIIIKWPDL